MNKIFFEIEDDVVTRYTPMPEAGENIYRTEVVMSKEIFQECYKKWVEPQEISDRNLKMWHDIYAEEKRREGSDKE